jgi:thymidine kinase
MDTLLYAPVVDDRYGTGKITTRIGLQQSAIPVDSTLDIFISVKKSE